MGQKVHPTGIRLGIVKDWSSRWYATSKDFADTLCADIKVREYLYKKLAQAGISRIQIDRPARNAKIIVYTARPGVIIGKSGKEVETLRDEINKILNVPVHVSIEEVRKPELDAKLVAEAVAQQLEKRVMFRRAMKRAVTTAMKLGAKGIKICVSGRLGGAEIARCEWYREGRVPLHTLRADIDYGTGEAFTTYGVIGVKVWIFKGEVIGDKDQAESGTEKTSAKQEK
ncbi:MAG TPA: 30S ribosomal protein S3 [Gammaproteobacteria bacterium]|nr:30S ribosomal protein S3 [Gammaproteobacteria bacterium]